LVDILRGGHTPGEIVRRCGWWGSEDKPQLFVESETGG
jgi:hypothetical protein